MSIHSTPKARNESAITLGAGLGLIFGAALDQVALGLVLGAAIGRLCPALLNRLRKDHGGDDEAPS